MSDKYYCDLCTKIFDAKDEEELADVQSIEQNGRCLDCLEEWGNTWPDRNY